MSLVFTLIQQHPVLVAVTTIIVLFVLNKLASMDQPKPSTQKKPKKPKKKKQVVNGTKTVKLSEVRKHNRIDDLWIVVDNKVYDVTEYIDVHPGGEVIARNAGSDATKGFHGIQHPSRVYEVIEEFYVGDLADEDKFKELKWDEVKTHNTESDLWIVVNDKVLNVTEWAQRHPGGSEVLLKKGGQDVTQEFFDGHPKSVHKMIHDYMIGYVYTGDELNDRSLRDQKRRIRRAKYTKEEVAKHNKANDCWIIINHHIYDVTGFVDEHPGGESIMNNAGGDSTLGFNGDQHDETARAMLKQFYVGDLLE